MIVVQVADSYLRRAVCRAAHPEEDVIVDARLAADAMEWGFPRLIVRAEGDGGCAHSTRVHNDAAARGSVRDVVGGAFEEVMFKVPERVGDERPIVREGGFEFAAVANGADAVSGWGGFSAELLPF